MMEFHVDVSHKSGIGIVKGQTIVTLKCLVKTP